MPFSPVDLFRVLPAALFILGPGLLLLEPLFGANKPRGAAGLALGLCLGLGAFGLFLWLDTFARVPLWEWLWGWPALVSVGVVAIAIRQRRRRARGLPAPDLATAMPDFSGAPGRQLALILALSAGAALYFGSYASGGADAWDYLNRASTILRAGRLDAGSPYAPGLHDPYDPTFYGLIATLTKLSGVSADLVWRYFPVIATPLEIGVVAVTTAAVIGSAGAGVAAGGVYAIFYGVFFVFRNSGHHQMLGDTLLLTSLAALFLYRRSGRRRHLILGALAVAAGTTYHHFLVVQCAFTIGLAGLVLLAIDRRTPGGWRRPVFYTAAVAAALLPAVVSLFGSHLKAVDPKAMDEFFRQQYAPLRYFGPLYIPDPFNWFFRNFWHPVPALLLLVPLRHRLLRDPRAAVLAVLLLAPVLIVMNPLVFPLVAGAIGLQVSTRLLNMTTYPSILLFGWLIAEALPRRAPGAPPEAPLPANPAPPIPRRTALVCVTLSLLVVLPQTLLRAQGDYYPASIARELGDSPLAWKGALTTLAGVARPGQTVMSDAFTSFSLPTFAPLYVITIPRADFAFQTPDFARRQAANATVLDPLASPDSTLAALAAFKVDWVLVNRRFTSPLTVEKLDYLAANGGALRRRFEHEGIVAWAVDPAALTGPAPAAQPLLDRLLVSREVFASFTEPGTGIVFDSGRGAGGVLGPDHLSPGDTLYVTFYYQKSATLRGHSLNAKLLKEERYGSSGRRVMRQVRGSILGVLEVVLFPRVLAFEEFQASALPEGSLYADPFTIPLSPALSPGRYTLYASPDAFPTDGALGLKLGSVEVGPRGRADSKRRP